MVPDATGVGHLIETLDDTSGGDVAILEACAALARSFRDTEVARVTAGQSSEPLPWLG